MSIAFLAVVLLAGQPAPADSLMILPLKSGIELVHVVDSVIVTHPVMDRPMKVDQGFFPREAGKNTPALEIDAFIEADTLHVFSPSNHVACRIPFDMLPDLASGATTVEPTFIFEGNDPTTAPIFLVVRGASSDQIVTWMPAAASISATQPRLREPTSVVHSTRSRAAYAPANHSGETPTAYLTAVDSISCNGLQYEATDFIIDGRTGAVAYQGRPVVSAIIDLGVTPDAKPILQAVNCKTGMPVYIPLE